MMCGGERLHMKLRDKHIEQERERERVVERERERVVERETAQDDPVSEIVNHFSHGHPLIYTESTCAEFCCDTCTGTGHGKRYHCALCNFDLHKICAQTPIAWLLHDMPPDKLEACGVRFNSADTFAHPLHSVVAKYRRRSFRCDHCNDSGNGIRFHCDACNLGLHQVCAEHPTRLASYLHPEHELELKLRPYFKTCNLCGTTGSTMNSRMYRCKPCQFYLHPGCSQWPQYLVHPLHPPHPLVLKPRGDNAYTCSSCKEIMTGYKYSCKVCKLDFDPRCIWQQAKHEYGDEVRQNYTEQHQITVLPVTNLTLPDTAYQSRSAQPATPFSALGNVRAGLAISLIGVGGGG